MNTILAIQFRENADTILAEQQSFLRVFNKMDAGIAFIDALDLRLDWSQPEGIVSGFAGVLLCGSGDFDFDGGRANDDRQKQMSYVILEKMKPFLEYLFRCGIPVLGICYGHQLLGAFHGIPVINRKEQAKTGSYEVSITLEGDALMAGMPPHFVGQYGHKDSLQSLPPGACVVARGINCDYAIIKYSPIAYGVQLHPELTAEDMRQRLQKNPGYLPKGVMVDNLIQPSAEAELILKNFVRIAIAQKRRFQND